MFLLLGRQWQLDVLEVCVCFVARESRDGMGLVEEPLLHSDPHPRPERGQIFPYPEEASDLLRSNTDYRVCLAALFHHCWIGLGCESIFIGQPPTNTAIQVCPGTHSISYPWIPWY